MKTAIDHIIEFLTGRDEFVLSSDIHNYMCDAGYRRKTSETILSRLVCDGVLIREGLGRCSRCKINADYSPVAVNKINRVSENNSFDEYRMCSRLYEMDTLLRTVRAANATERQHNASDL